MDKLLDKAKEKHILSKEEIVYLLNLEDAAKLFFVADEVRKKYLGDDVHLRALIEFSNICRCNCFYCGLRCENKNIKRYRLSEEEILSTVEQAVNVGYRTVVMQSGEDVYYSVDFLSELIKKIKKYDVALTLGIGERSKEEYRRLKEAGADRFLLRIETTDKKLYEQLHPNMSFENRQRCLYDLKELGFETGSGCLVGLPNQTLESLADDILFFKKLNADMIGIGPFISHPDTPLKNIANGNFELSLKVMAITRLLLPDINIPATTAMETLHPNGRLIALQAGANVIMPNVTDIAYSKNYNLYPGKVKQNNTLVNNRKEIEEKIKSIGRTISLTKGMRKNFRG